VDPAAGRFSVLSSVGEETCVVGREVGEEGGRLGEESKSFEFEEVEEDGSKISSYLYIIQQFSLSSLPAKECESDRGRTSLS